MEPELPLVIALYGGSNSFMGGGYATLLPDEVRDLLPREVELRNSSMGNTFVHYGLWEAASRGPHLGADVVLIEYAVNDQELINHRVKPLWQCGYEGLVRKVQAENPFARIVSVVLWQIRHYRLLQEGRSWRLADDIRDITARHGGTTFDSVADFTDGNGGSLPSTDEVFKDGAHYNSAYQKRVAKGLASHIKRILEDPIVRADDQLMPALGACADFSMAQAIGLRGLHDLAATPRMSEFTNSRATVQSLELIGGETLRFRLTGYLVALIYAATPNDGVVRVEIGDQAVNLSAYRRAYVNPKTETRWPFLLSNILPALALRQVPKETHGVVEITLLGAEAEQDLGPEDVFYRGSTVPPPPRRVRTLNLRDVLFVGSISPY
jgi:hypothetical protein